jgi:hypothetical protein
MVKKSTQPRRLYSMRFCTPAAVGVGDFTTRRLPLRILEIMSRKALNDAIFMDSRRRADLFGMKIAHRKARGKRKPYV